MNEEPHDEREITDEERLDPDAPSADVPPDAVEPDGAAAEAGETEMPEPTPGLAGGDGARERGDSTDDGDDDRAEPATPAEVAETAKQFVSGLLEAMGLGGDVSTSIDGPTAHVDVTGDDLGALIGRRGQTLDALQEVARAAVQRRLRSRVRLAVDVEGYRARRRESLADYAREMAERAKERGTEIELEPMTAYERKVIHDAVGEVDGASSFSEGEEPHRKVVIRGD